MHMPLYKTRYIVQLPLIIKSTPTCQGQGRWRGRYLVALHSALLQAWLLGVGLGTDLGRMRHVSYSWPFKAGQVQLARYSWWEIGKVQPEKRAKQAQTINGPAGLPIG